MERDVKKVEQLREKDELFKLFCDGINSIPNIHRNHAQLLALEESWALFLLKMKKNKNKLPH